jgi:hypothetical protein
MKLWMVISALATGVTVGGCDAETSAPPLPTSADLPAPSASPTTRPRSRAYFVENIEEVCAVYWQEGGRSSVRKEIACPREIEPGERLRLAGRTCMREAAKVERNVPVRCPKQVLYAEQCDLQGKGEFKLSPAK